MNSFFEELYVYRLLFAMPSSFARRSIVTPGSPQVFTIDARALKNGFGSGIFEKSITADFSISFMRSVEILFSGL